MGLLILFEVMLLVIKFWIPLWTKIAKEQWGVLENAYIIPRFIIWLMLEYG